CVEFIGKAAKRVVTTAKAVRQISCDRPDVRRHIALTKASFVNLQIMFKLRGLRFNLCNTIHRPGGAARPVRVRLLLRLMLFFMSHSAHLCEAARLVFNCLDPLVQLIELLLLPLILHAQALVLALYAKMHGLLRQSVKTVERGAEEYGCNSCRDFEPALMDTDTAYAGTGTRSVGDDKSVKAVVSVYHDVLLRAYST